MAGDLYARAAIARRKPGRWNRFRRFRRFPTPRLRKVLSVLSMAAKPMPAPVAAHDAARLVDSSDQTFEESIMKPKWETTAPLEPELTEERQREARFLARVATEPSVNAGRVIAEFGPRFTNLTLNALVERLSQSIKCVEANDMRPSEAMLFTQAVALQSIFSEMAQRAAQRGGRLDEVERCMRMALKAQNQCRMTLETLAALKNPRVIVAQQTNIANGPQQVNNGPTTSGDSRGAHTRADSDEAVQNKLLEVGNGERLDARAEGAAGGSNPEMAAVGSLDRPTDH
jgi:hypothetical protein